MARCSECRGLGFEAVVSGCIPKEYSEGTWTLQFTHQGQETTMEHFVTDPRKPTRLVADRASSFGLVLRVHAQR